MSGSIWIPELSGVVSISSVTLQSGYGYAASALLSGQIASGLLYQPLPRISGEDQRYFPTVPSFRCPKCGRGHSCMAVTGVTVADVSGFVQVWCWSCAGYKYVCVEGGVTGRFETKEDWIRESVPLESGTPAGIIADWLTDQSRYKEADYMREVADREMRMSGG